MALMLAPTADTRLSHSTDRSHSQTADGDRPGRAGHSKLSDGGDALLRAIIAWVRVCEREYMFILLAQRCT